MRSLPFSEALHGAYLRRADAIANRRRERAWADAPLQVTSQDRIARPFLRDAVLARCSGVRTIEGRDYHFVYYPGTGSALCVHFSAFFGEWGDRPIHSRQFQGHFHRLRMFWPVVEHSFLFLCDTAGVDRNGSYYKGEHMDFFVERAMNRLLDEYTAGVHHVVGLGSSMGATAAVRFALQRQWTGAVGVVPHLDLDICAALQGRQRHVAAVLGGEHTQAASFYPVTREIRHLASAVEPVPRISLQSFEDDHGVHFEQVLPFVAAYQLRGGDVRLETHAIGGHSSDLATPDWFARQVDWVLP
jgi:hypothetical protein